jgi:hypothetical protein
VAGQRELLTQRRQTRRVFSKLALRVHPLALRGAPRLERFAGQLQRVAVIDLDRLLHGDEGAIGGDVGGGARHLAGKGEGGGIALVAHRFGPGGGALHLPANTPGGGQGVTGGQTH